MTRRFVTLTLTGVPAAALLLTLRKDAMKHIHRSYVLAAVLIALAGAVGLHAARHPKYLHARSDLETAQYYLDLEAKVSSGAVLGHVKGAHDLCSAAVHEMDTAAVIDRKDINPNPPHDTINERAGRLRKVIQLLASARQDILTEEDNNRAANWRDAAVRHIDEATKFVKEAAHELGFSL